MLIRGLRISGEYSSEFTFTRRPRIARGPLVNIPNREGICVPSLAKNSLPAKGTMVAERTSTRGWSRPEPRSPPTRTAG